MTAPIIDQGVVTGVLVAELSVDEIDAIITGGRRWRNEGQNRSRGAGWPCGQSRAYAPAASTASSWRPSATMSPPPWARNEH